MKVLVTGGCGFIGKNLVKSLDLSSVTVVDNLSNNSCNDLPNGVEFVDSNINDFEKCKELCHGKRAVVHLAAKTGVAQSVEDPIRDCQENVLGTLNILEAARQEGVKKFIFASSGCVVGNQPPPFHELMIRMPSSPYAASKASCEMYCQAYYDSFGLETIVLRFSNVYGPHSEHKSFNLIPALIINAFKGDTTKIYGDGKQTRDYIYVGDVVQGIKNSLMCDNNGHQIYQLGTGVPSSIQDVIRTMDNILDEYDKRTWTSYFEERPGELKNNFVNYHKAFATLKFEPRFNLEKGLKETVKWYVENVVENKK